MEDHLDMMEDDQDRMEDNLDDRQPKFVHSSIFLYINEGSMN